MSRRFQFSLKALVIAVAVAAVCCAVWTWLPEWTKPAVVFGLPIAAIAVACECLRSQLAPWRRRP